MFRPSRPEDYVSLSVNYDFPTTSNPLIRHEVIEFFASCFESTEVLDYVLTVLAFALCGNRKFEQFYTLTGRGRNGKGTIANFLQKVLGDYVRVIDSTFFTCSKKSSSGHCSEIACCEGARILMSTEPDDSQKLQVNKIKELTGKDRIQTREIYQKSNTWVPQFTIFLQCNDIPEPSHIDEAFTKNHRIPLHIHGLTHIIKTKVKVTLRSKNLKSIVPNEVGECMLTLICHR